MPTQAPSSFAQRIIAWQKIHGRHHLPWQSDNPYHVWLSEIMLQQTQVSTVLNYYAKFIHKLPTVSALAQAEEDTVLSLWSGLGYYSRARNLHHAAKQITTQYHGKFPDNRTQLTQLKGIGRTTAAAIAVFAFGQREAILDGNVKRVFIRHHAIDSPSDNTKTINQLWTLAEAQLPYCSADLRHYTQGLMDLGSLICTRSKPDCRKCPVQIDCLAYKQNLTSVLPRKKISRKKPSKTTVMLILSHQQTLHLQRRADSGIWRSLWSFPEFDDIEAAQQYAQTHGKIIRTQALNPIKHQFTHFTLHIQPLVIELAQIPPTPHFSRQIALTKGIPQPVRRLIEGL